MPTRVALVSCAEARQLDQDLAPIVSALAALGIEAEIVDWDNATENWEQFSVAIVRSAWDYHARLGEYLAWIDRVATVTRLMNPPEVLKWNCDKRYLRELEHAGISVVPTTFVESHGELAATDLNGDVVLKPAVSAGSNNTRRFRGDAPSATRFAERLLDEGHVVMVQPYQGSIDEHGEIGLVYIEGEFSHAFHKEAILGDKEFGMNELFAEEEIGPAHAGRDARALGEQVMEFLRGRFATVPLYARVDTVIDDAGHVAIMEVEANEPSLYFFTDPNSAQRFARATAGVASVS